MYYYSYFNFLACNQVYERRRPWYERDLNLIEFIKSLLAKLETSLYYYWCIVQFMGKKAYSTKKFSNIFLSCLPNKFLLFHSKN